MPRVAPGETNGGCKEAIEDAMQAPEQRSHREELLKTSEVQPVDEVQHKDRPRTLDLAQGPRGVANSQDVRQKILGDHGSCTDDGVLTNRHARAHDDTATEPNIVTDRNRLSSLKLVASGAGLDRMDWRQQLDIRTNLHVVADRDLGNVQRDQTEVHERARTHTDVHAVVDIQRRSDDGVLAQRPQQVVKNSARAAGVVFHIWAYRSASCCALRISASSSSSTVYQCPASIR